MSEVSKPHSEPDEPKLSDYIDMEAYDVVPGEVHRRLVEQFDAVVEATRFKEDEDCWCAFRQVDDPDWHSPQCERVREVLGISNPAKEPK